MAGPIASLVLARLRRRGATAALSVAAVAAATALIAIVSGIGVVASDAAVGRALGTGGAARPVVRISQFSATAEDLAATRASAETALAGRLGGLTLPAVRGVLGRELRDLAAPVFELVVAVDDPAPWLTLLDGRLPAPCHDGRRCEAVLLSEVAPDLEFTEAHPARDLELSIVGRGLLDPAVPFGELDQRGPFGQLPVGGGEYQTERASPAVLLVDGVDAIANAPAFEVTGRTYVWTVPLDVTSIHPWTADRYRDAIGGLTRDLAREDTAFSVASPVPQLDIAVARGEAGRGRLGLIGSLGVAILLAFVVFLAFVVRDDVGAEMTRLVAIGARRRDRGWFLLLESLVPAAVGGVLGWGFGAFAVAALASGMGADVAAVLGEALFTPGLMLLALGVIGIVMIATILATAPGLAHAGVVRAIVAVAGTTTILLAWQLATTGPLVASNLAGALASPVIILLPPALAFLAALLLATVLPPLLRALTRRLTNAPLPVRLSLLSISRDPGRPVATVTLLAFSLGAIVFATGWSASLRQGIDDAAAYRSGLDLRVTELGTGLSIARSVVPVDRYATLGPDVTATPVYLDATTTQPGGRVDILGIAPDALAGLPGWRDDFSSIPVRELADHLRVPAPAGGWAVGGHRLPTGDRQLTVRFRYEGDSLRLNAVVWTDGGDATTVPLGTIRDGMTSASGPLPDSAVGGLLTALIFGNDRFVAGPAHQHGVFRATVAFHELDGLVDETPIDLEIFTVSTVIVRAPQVTDGVVLPAVVSPDLAMDAGPDGALELHVGSGSMPLRVVGTATRTPAIVEPRPRFVIVPLDPFVVALASAVPGAGRPTEMWISAPTPNRLAEVRAALADTPFRFAQVTARSDLVAQGAGDPLSQAIVWSLVVAALAGLILSVGGLLLGAVTDLRDERGELADLETQGVPPSSLRWHALGRTAWLAGGGAVAGLVAGLLLTVVMIRALAVDAEGGLPIPPLTVVLPLDAIAVVVVGVIALVLGGVGVLARRTYGRATLGERRAPHDERSSRASWSAGSGAVDG